MIIGSIGLSEAAQQAAPDGGSEKALQRKPWQGLSFVSAPAVGLEPTTP